MPKSYNLTEKEKKEIEKLLRRLNNSTYKNSLIDTVFNIEEGKKIYKEGNSVVITIDLDELNEHNEKTLWYSLYYNFDSGTAILAADFPFKSGKALFQCHNPDKMNLELSLSLQFPYDKESQTEKVFLYNTFAANALEYVNEKDRLIFASFVAKTLLTDNEKYKKTMEIVNNKSFVDFQFLLGKNANITEEELKKRITVNIPLKYYLEYLIVRQATPKMLIVSKVEAKSSDVKINLEKDGLSAVKKIKENATNEFLHFYTINTNFLEFVKELSIHFKYPLSIAFKRKNKKESEIIDGKKYVKQAGKYIIVDEIELNCK